MTWMNAALLALGSAALFGLLAMVLPQRDVRRVMLCMWVALFVSLVATLMVATNQ